VSVIAPPDPLNGRGTPAPWYARLGMDVLTNVAPTMIILGVLIAIVTGWLPFPVLTAVLGLRADVSAIEKRLSEVERNTLALTRIFEGQLAAQKRICYNTGKTDEDRKQCYP
jgi:hypothetical protein